MSTIPNTTSNRDTKGRFTKGNPGGPGNPFARKQAAFRKALLAVVTEQDIQDIAAVLLLKAKTGDVACAKVVFSYVIGQPTEAVDPDTLDQQEWQALAEGIVSTEEVGEKIKGVKPWIACQLARNLGIHIGEKEVEQTMPVQPQAKPVEPAPSPNDANGHATKNGKAKQTPAAPSPNGSNGNGKHAHSTEERRPAPSRNGGNGGHQPAAKGRLPFNRISGRLRLGSPELQEV